MHISLSCNQPIVLVVEQPQRCFVCFQTTIGTTARRQWGHRANCRTSRARACLIERSSFFIFLSASCRCCFRLSEGDSHVAGTGLPVLVFIGRWSDRRRSVRARLPVSGTPSPGKWWTSATKWAALI